MTSIRTPAPTGVQDREAAARLLDEVKKAGVRFINLEFTDVVGIAKCVTIPAEQLPEVLRRGKWFDGSSIEGFARGAETDMFLCPDVSTYAPVPWRTSHPAEHDSNAGAVARIICDVLLPSGEPFPGDPRSVLRRALQHAAKLGFLFDVATELEFFLLREDAAENVLREPSPHDRGGYFDLSTHVVADVQREIMAVLKDMHVQVESSHHEVAAGQHEIDFAAMDALHGADAIVTARYAVKAVAQQHGMWATFLPKPFFSINGSGMHVHQQLRHHREHANAFADVADTEYGLSLVARQFVAGQLAHAQGMCAIVAPLVNSYKRLVKGFEAPVMINWGRVNREALIRVPRASSGSPAEVRIELRDPDPSCNPYLAFALMLSAGLDGIERDLPLASPVEETLTTLDEHTRVLRGIELLPGTLGDALAALTADNVMVEALGQQLTDWFITAKMREWEEYRTMVHPWELERYLAIF